MRDPKTVERLSPNAKLGEEMKFLTHFFAYDRLRDLLVPRIENSGEWA